MYFGAHFGFLFKCIEREQKCQRHSWNDCISLKLYTAIHDKICLHMHICTQWIRHESILHIVSVVCYGNMQDNVALWGEMQDKHKTKYPGVSAGYEKWSGQTKTAFSCLCLFIFHICRKWLVYSNNTQLPGTLWCSSLLAYILTQSCYI